MNFVFDRAWCAGTGIASHTDFVNFVQTSHLGLDIPDGDCWIKVKFREIVLYIGGFTACVA